MIRKGAIRMIKYKVCKRITVSSDDIASPQWNTRFNLMYEKIKGKENTLCYKLIAGLSVFYVSEKVLQELIVLDMVEPFEEVEGFKFSTMRLHIGIALYNRIADAINSSTIDKLKATLERANNEPKQVCVRRFTCDWEVSSNSEDYEVKLSLRDLYHIDIEKQKIIFRQGLYVDDIASPFYRVYNYESLLEALTEELDRVYGNVEHIMDKFKECNGFSMLTSTMYKNKYEVDFIK